MLQNAKVTTSEHAENRELCQITIKNVEKLRIEQYFSIHTITNYSKYCCYSFMP